MEKTNIAGFQLIKQGAEGRLYKGTYLGKPAIIKERFIKKYRHPDLDTFLTKERIKSECRAIIRCKSCNIKTPTIYLVDLEKRSIYMQHYVQSITVKDWISSASTEDIQKLSLSIGKTLGRMHRNNIVHGDLTTSNILLSNINHEDSYEKLEDLEVIFIDFGLAHLEATTEDKGVDLYVLERALTSTHSVAEQMFAAIIDGYREENKKNFNEIWHKYQEVRARGRKRTMIG